MSCCVGDGGCPWCRPDVYMPEPDTYKPVSNEEINKLVARFFGTMNVDINYLSLKRILESAYRQSAVGKGAERHNPNKIPFDEQEIVKSGVELGSNHFQLGQARKKTIESARLDPQKAVHELLGAIVYNAAAILVLEKLYGDKLVGDEIYFKEDKPNG